MYKYLFKSWLPLAIASTVIMLTVYAAVQQSIRQAANDPQIQMAEDGAVALAASSTPAVLIGVTKVEMSKSLAPFYIVYDETGKVLAASGFLNGRIPVPPSGVFDFARDNFENRLTWQPSSETRIAAVVRRFSANVGAANVGAANAVTTNSGGKNVNGSNSGFVLAGRNMREIESREKQVGLMVGAAWVGLLILTLIISIYGRVAPSKGNSYNHDI